MTDRLHHVKRYYIGVGLDGFGARKWMPNDMLDSDLRILHDWIQPALHDAITTHDPGWTHEIIDAEILGRRWETPDSPGSLTAATGTEAVQWFVDLMEGGAAWLRLIGAQRDRLYERLFASSVQYGCYLDGLRDALAADAPQWRAS